MSNIWWDGTDKLKLSLSQIEAKWGQQDHSLTRLEILNKAFEIYYLSIQGYFSCSDSNQANQMWKELNVAAKEGWGRGVSDLKEAFNHVDKNNGVWRDNNLENYYGGDPGDLFQYPLIDAPEAAVNFIEKMEEKTAKLIKIMQKFEKQADIILRETQKAKNGWD